MKMLVTLFLRVAGILAILVQCSQTQMGIENIKMCESLSGKECLSENTLFNSSTPQIYCSFSITNVEIEDTLKIIWYYLGDNRIMIEETPLVMQKKEAEKFILTSLHRPINGWPSGIYEVKISLAKKLSRIRSFSIK